MTLGANCDLAVTLRGRAVTVRVTVRRFYPAGGGGGSAGPREAAGRGPGAAAADVRGGSGGGGWHRKTGSEAGALAWVIVSGG